MANRKKIIVILFLINSIVCEEMERGISYRTLQRRISVREKQMNQKYDENIQNLMGLKTSEIRKILEKLEILEDREHCSDARIQDELLTKVENACKSLVDEISMLSLKKITDKNLRRQIHLLNTTDILCSEVRNVSTDITKILSVPVACAFDDLHDCGIEYSPGIERRMLSSDSPLEQAYYWVEWRNKISNLARKKFQEYVENYSNISKVEGFASPLKMRYSRFENYEILDEFYFLSKNIRSLYKEIHSFVRNKLYEKNGGYYVHKTDPISEYLLEPIDDDFLAKDYQLELSQDFVSLYSDPYNLLKFADSYLISMGFQNFSRNFWTKHSKIVDADTDCLPAVKRGRLSQKILLCPNFTTTKQLLQLPSEILKFRYRYQLSSLPFGLHEESCPGFGAAIGKSIQLAVQSPKNLQRLGLLKQFGSDEDHVKYLLKKGLRSILNLPKYIVYEKILADALNGTVEVKEINCAYWKLMELVLGVDAPITRNNHNFDFSKKFYLSVNEPPHQYIIQEVMGHQIFKALCVKSGQYNDTDGSRLHECDFYGNKIIGDTLQEIMSYGGKKSWKEILNFITGERSLNSDGFVEYYQPVENWVRKENKRANATVGWILTNKCNE